VARVLDRQGVDVTSTDSFDEAIGRAGAGTTLLVVDSGIAYPPEALDRLASTGADLVLLAPGFLTISSVVPAIAAADIADGDGTVAPQCDDPDARAAGDLVARGEVYVAVPSEGDTVVLCYPQGAGEGTYAVVTDGTRRITVLGDPLLLTNEDVAVEGSAAIALRTLGRNADLVWYLPDPLDPAFARPDAVEDPSTLGLLPSWVRWVVAQLVVVLLVVVVWRFRRLGRLIPERLPAVVRSAETTEGRARLYRQARARERAAALLRADATRVLGARLGAVRGAGAGEVATLAAPAARRDPVLVRDLLAGPPPGDDIGLVRLADALDGLVADVRSRPAPTTPGPSQQEGRRP
jgi:hypothetical protein